MCVWPPCAPKQIPELPSPSTLPSRPCPEGTTGLSPGVQPGFNPGEPSLAPSRPERTLVFLDENIDSIIFYQFSAAPTWAAFATVLGIAGEKHNRKSRHLQQGARIGNRLAVDTYGYTGTDELEGVIDDIVLAGTLAALAGIAYERANQDASARAAWTAFKAALRSLLVSIRRIRPQHPPDFPAILPSQLSRLPRNLEPAKQILLWTSTFAKSRIGI